MTTSSSASTTSDCLKNLPSFKKDNFSKLDSNLPNRGSSLAKPKIQLYTVEHPQEQIITTEKTSCLLRYLHKQWDKKSNLKKRDLRREDSDSDVAGPSTSTDLNALNGQPPRKMPRIT